jgi:hypothetical protein
MSIWGEVPLKAIGPCNTISDRCLMDKRCASAGERRKEWTEAGVEGEPCAASI